ncbi:MAG: hypothetical protein V4726_06035 [Verrucomicrobiota bacterium]
MKFRPLVTWFPFRFALIIAPLVAAWPQRAQAGDFIFDNNGSLTYFSNTNPNTTSMSLWNVANNWNPNALPGGAYDNAFFTGAAPNPAASQVVGIDMQGIDSLKLNQLVFTGNPANISQWNLTNTTGTTALTVNKIILQAGPTAQINPSVPLTAAVDPLTNPTGRLTALNTTGSSLQLQSQITTGAGGLVKDGTGGLRLGSSGATFTNAIGGDIVINNGTLQASNGASGNVLGGTGKIIMNGPGTVLQLNADAATSYGRDVTVNANATINADRSGTTATGQTLSLGTITMGANDKYLSLTSGNSYNISLAGLNFGANTVNIRNGMNNTAGLDTTGHVLAGALNGSGAVNISGGGGNSTVGFNFNTASPGFTGRLGLFEGGNHIVSATGALGSANVTLGEASNLMPVTYPNIAVGSSGSPTVQSNPWSVLLKYNANNPTSGTITVNGASQISMGVVPNATDKITLREYGILQGNGAELAGFNAGAGGNLTLPASNAVIAHEALDGADPTGLALTASHYYGAAATLNGALTVGAGTAWKGVSNDRFARTVGGGATTLTVNGGDNNAATTEVTFAALNGQNLTVLNTLNDVFASASGQKFSIAIEGFGNPFNSLGSGQAPGGNVRFEQTAAASGLAANVDVINVNSGNLQLGASGLGGVTLNINRGGGVDLIGAVTNALDGPVNVNNGGTLVLNDAAVMSGGAANPITINSGGRFHITGTAPANILSGSTQPITFSGTGHTVRVSTDNVTGLDAAVPDTGAVWEAGTNGTNNNVVNAWGTTFAVNIGRTVIQTAGLSTNGGIITNDTGTRFLDAPLTIGNSGATFAATTGTSLVLNDTTTNTGVVIGTGASAGTIPVQIGSLTPINDLSKTHNPTGVQNNDAVLENTHNGSPQVIFANGLKSGTVNLVTGSLGLDGPNANNKIQGDINMGNGTRLYLAEGGNLAFGSALAAATSPRRADLTAGIVDGTLVSGTINVGNKARIEMGLDATDPVLTAATVDGRVQVSQSFTIAAGADLMDVDRRNLYVNRVTNATGTIPVLNADFNNITLGDKSNLVIQEAGTDIRASVRLQGDATAAAWALGAAGFDLKNVTNGGGAGTRTLNIGREDMPFSTIALYGAVDAGVSISTTYGKLEVRDGATLPSGFVFNDNAVNARAIQSNQNATPTGPNAGNDQTLSIFKGQTGAAGTGLTTGTFNMNAANNAVGLYANDAASGAPIVNDIKSTINLNKTGQVVFSGRGNGDAAVNGIARIQTVNVNAANATLATRDLTDLEVTSLNISTNSVIKVDGGRTDGQGAVRIANVAAAANDVQFQDGRTTITGNVTAGRLTAGGTSLEFNPGAAATSTVNAASVQVNTLLAAKSGNTNFGNTVLKSDAAGTTVAGLREGVILGNAGDFTTANPGSNPATANQNDSSNTGIRLDPRVANNNYSNDTATGTDTARGWSQNQTFVYTGQIHDADGIFTLAEQIDDNVQIMIDGVVVLTSNGSPSGTGLGAQGPFQVYQTTTNTASRDGLSNAYLQPVTGGGDIGQGLANTTTLNANPAGGTTSFGMGSGGDGWHNIEIRVGNGSGGAGPNAANGWGQYFGIGLNAAGGDALTGTSYDKAIDNGSMNLFRTTTVAKGNVEVDNGATLTAGNLQTIGQLTYGKAGAAGDAKVILGAAGNGTVDVINVATTAGGTTSLSLNLATTKLQVGQLNVADGKNFVLNPGSGPIGELEILQGSAAVNPLAGIIVEGGTLRLSNTTGSATGQAPITLNGGTLAGNGITAGQVNLNGGQLAPSGVNAVLTTGNLVATGGTVRLNIQGPGAAANGTNYDVLNVIGNVNLGLGTVLALDLGYTPVVGDTFWTVLNDGVDPVTGNFLGLAEGGTFTSGLYTFQITYLADGSLTGPSSFTGGNDIALRTLAVPEASTAGLAGLTALLALRRRRSRIAA